MGSIQTTHRWHGCTDAGPVMLQMFHHKCIRYLSYNLAYQKNKRRNHGVMPANIGCSKTRLVIWNSIWMYNVGSINHQGVVGIWRGKVMHARNSSKWAPDIYVHGQPVWVYLIASDHSTISTVLQIWLIGQIGSYERHCIIYVITNWDCHDHYDNDGVTKHRDTKRNATHAPSGIAILSMWRWKSTEGI